MRVENTHTELVDRARLGDRSSLGRLAELVEDRMYPFLYRATLNGDIAHDLLQETLLAMTRDIGRLRNAGRFWNWIYRIAWSRVQQHLRDQQDRVRLHTTVFENNHRRERLREDDSNGILKVLVYKERLERVSTAVNKLGGRDRDIFELRCFEQMPYSEIASTLRCSSEQARVRFHRAKEVLRCSLCSTGYPKG